MYSHNELCGDCYASPVLTLLSLESIVTCLRNHRFEAETGHCDAQKKGTNWNLRSNNKLIYMF